MFRLFLASKMVGYSDLLGVFFFFFLPTRDGANYQNFY